MLLKKFFNFRRTLVFRLTLLYILSVLVFLGAFVIYRLHRDVNHYENIDRGLISEARATSQLLETIKEMDRKNIESFLDYYAKYSWKLFARILGQNGEVIASSDLSFLKMDLSGAISERPDSETGYTFNTLPLPGSNYTARIISYTVGTDKVLQIGTSQEGLQRIIEKRWKEFGIIMTLLVVFSAFVGWFVAKIALVGVKEITSTAVQISEGDFSSRVPVKGRGEEIDNLANTFNNMVERIEALIKGMKEITDNMAHDLRSPITRIRCAAEMAVTGPGDKQGYESMAGNIVEECDRLLEMINTMMDISEAEAGLSKLNMSMIDISRITEETCELFQPVAEDKNIKIIMNLAKGAVINADKQKLQRVVSNLLDNAIKYTPAGGTINVTVESDEGQVMVSVNDNGLGISLDDLPNIFKRFYRCDRSRSLPGNGLGLSWTKAIIQAHGGNISAASILNEKSTFTFTLPRTPLPA
ncbi:MAG: HAMP domain-containing protein [Deltaproteobacteria bacterium]|nr:HAMP domain-containing protein [Deltaproteobacteria bacterium]